MDGSEADAPAGDPAGRSAAHPLRAAQSRSLRSHGLPYAASFVEDASSAVLYGSWQSKTTARFGYRSRGRDGLVGHGEDARRPALDGNARTTFFRTHAFRSRRDLVVLVHDRSTFETRSVRFNLLWRGYRLRPALRTDRETVPFDSRGHTSHRSVPA